MPDGLLLFNQTHIPAFPHLNPCSTSIPKNGTPHGYMTLENGEFAWKDLATGEVYRRERIY